MLVALSTLTSARSKVIEETTPALSQLLDYCATHPDKKLRYHASGVALRTHSNASYLSELHAISRAGGGGGVIG